MMSDSIKELIMKNIHTTLESITTANGYDNTIESVQRHQVEGQDTVAMPYIVIVQGDETIDSKAPDPLVSKQLEVHLDVLTKQDLDTDSRQGDEIMNSLEADIERALQVDPQRGGNAVDTDTLEVMPLAVEEDEDGLTDINSIMSFRVDYRQNRKNPKSI